MAGVVPELPLRGGPPAACPSPNSPDGYHNYESRCRYETEREIWTHTCKYCGDSNEEIIDDVDPRPQRLNERIDMMESAARSLGWEYINSVDGKQARLLVRLKALRKQYQELCKANAAAEQQNESETWKP